MKNYVNSFGMVKKMFFVRDVIIIFIKKIEVGLNRSNCYLIGEKSNKIMVIDPGAEGEKIHSEIKAIQGEVKQIVNTHGHFDHIGANKYLKEKTQAKLMIHKNEKEFLQNPEKNFSLHLDSEDVVSPPADRLLKDGDQIEAGDYNFRVILTPGHSPGGISLYCEQENIIFCGDLIFKAGVGRTDLPGSDSGQLKKSITSILKEFDENTILYPGHGEQTTVVDFKKEVWDNMV